VRELVRAPEQAPGPEPVRAQVPVAACAVQAVPEIARRRIAAADEEIG